MEDWKVCVFGYSVTKDILMQEDSLISMIEKSSSALNESLKRNINQLKRRSERVSSANEMLLLQIHKDLEYFEII